MEILIGEDTYSLVKNDFRTTDMGAEEIQGFGTSRVYRLDGDHKPANDRFSY